MHGRKVAVAVRLSGHGRKARVGVRPTTGVREELRQVFRSEFDGGRRVLLQMCALTHMHAHTQTWHVKTSSMHMYVHAFLLDSIHLILE